jgi:N-acetylglucosaminyldiphosphoundecaprenol N-acetyl-beta-D-mannosaminyltransferase
MDRTDVIGCPIMAVTLQEALASLTSRVRDGTGGYICFVNVHTAVLGRQDAEFRRILEHSMMNLPDGWPLAMVGRRKGMRELKRVSGADFLAAVLGAKAKSPLKHYFYGGRPEVLESLVAQLRQRYPQADIVGSESPPFRKLNAQETREARQRIVDRGANLVWVGLGAPKQERWMADNWRQLNPSLLLGVGAAFDFHAGFRKRAPRWMREIGLEWLHRFIQEPGRLGKRYVYSNTWFVYYLLQDAIRLRRWSGSRRP